jgi:VWFA-related protein
MTVSRTIVVAIALSLTAAGLAGQQAPSPVQQTPPRPDPQMPPITFRAEVNYVEVDAVVRDAQGAFVRDLKKEDFQVFEDGTLQTVTAFSLIDIPVVRSERALFLPTDIDPDVRSNAGGPEGRLYVLLLDDIHTDAMRSIRVRQAAKQFVDRNLGANDLAAVIYTSGRSDAAQDLTSSRRLLSGAIDKFMGRKLRSAFLNRLDAYNLARQAGQTSNLFDPDQAQRVYNARSMLSTVKNLSDWLSGIHGRRKAVVLIGEGIDFVIWDSLGPSGIAQSFADSSRRGDGAFLLTETQDTIAAATRANVSIYAIDPRGLYLPGDEMMQISAVPVDNETLVTGVTALQDELRASQDSLRVLAEGTGGFASLTSNDFAGAFQRIVDENSSYYVLGYYSNNEKRDGRFRKIEVRPTRPGLEVKARKGYTAPRGKLTSDKKVEASAGTSKELRDALDSPLQVSDLKLAIFAAPLKGPGSKAAVAIVTQIVARDMTFVEKDGKFSNALEISYVAVDKQGKVAAGNRDSIAMALKRDTYERVLQAGFRVQSRLELPPGSYQLRVAAREGGGRAGSVHYDLLVPDFGKEPVAMSGLVLSSVAAGGVPTAGEVAELGKALPTPPTTERTFSANDELAVLAEIYDNQGAQPHAMDITATLKADGRVSVFTNTERRSSKELGGGKGGYGYTARIPLTDLAAGLYVLRVEAKSSLGDTAAVAREVQLRIVR